MQEENRLEPIQAVSRALQILEIIAFLRFRAKLSPEKIVSDTC